jgi:hypothetical protein
MGALTGPRDILQKGADFIGPVPVAAGATIYDGALVGKTAGGYAGPATAGAGVIALGIADLSWDDRNTANGQAIDLTGYTAQHGIAVANTLPGAADGDRQVKVRPGNFVFNNKGGDAVDATLIGENVYIEDDNTVKKTAGGSGVAGKLVGFDTELSLPIVQVFGYARAV